MTAFVPSGLAARQSGKAAAVGAPETVPVRALDAVQLVRVVGKDVVPRRVERAEVKTAAVVWRLAVGLAEAAEAPAPEWAADAEEVEEWEEARA